MGEAEEIAELMKTIIGSTERSKLQIANVISVDKDKNTAELSLINTGFKITAELQAKPSLSKGFHIYPVVDSSVMVLTNAFIKRYYILQMSEIESVVLTTADKPTIEIMQSGDINITGDKTININSDKDININSEQITFNSGNNDGLVLIKKLVERLNKIEEEYNAHITEFNTHTHMVAAVPATTPLASIVPTIPSTSLLVVTTQTQIENTKIKQ